MNTDYHSTFTPSESDPQTLEYLFVAREDLARNVMEGIAESTNSGNKHQRLLIGPRGIGKTHFVSLIYNRIFAEKNLSKRLRIAWLREDLYVAGYPDLLLETLRRLILEYSLPELELRLDGALDLTESRQREAVLEQLLVEIIGDKTLLIVAENLDDLLTDLKAEGQQKLRAFIQNQRSVTILATATSLVEAVTERKETFFGFFRIHTLSPLSVDEAAELLVRLANRVHDSELAGAIQSQMGKARLRAIHYLAGGNPRIYVIFYDFLNRDSLDDLARPFMKLMDELTPYYQARMSRLAPLQRRIIDVLRRLRGASNVSEIARQTMSSSQTISKQLGKLKGLGYVIQVDSLGRSNYYEMREPLMRLCLDVKEQKGRNVEIFVQFLRVWYSQAELGRLADAESADSQVAQLAMSEKDPLQSSLLHEFFSYQAVGNYEQALVAAEHSTSRNPELKENWTRKAQCLEALGGDLHERLKCWQRVAEIDPEDSLVWNRQDIIYTELERFERALEAAEKALKLKPADSTICRNYSSGLARVGRANEAREYRRKALALSGNPSTASDWDWKAIDLWELGKVDESMDAFRNALELDPHRTSTWDHLWGVLQEQGKFLPIMRMTSRLVELFPQEAFFHSKLGTAYSANDKFEKALTSFEAALELDPMLDQTGEPALLYQAITLDDLGRSQEALELLEKNMPIEAGRARRRFETARMKMQFNLGDWEGGRGELNRILEQYKPRFWSTKELGGLVGGPLIKSPNSSVWRSFIAVWLELFQRHHGLSELGKGLVYSLRVLRRPQISDEVAKTWYATWQERAGDVDELAVPLRLLAAGVEYRTTGDRRALLRLAREERGLLEPWIENLFEEERSVERSGFLRAAEKRLAEEAEAESSREFWQSPTPDLESLDFDRLMSDYCGTPFLRPLRLLPDSWEALGQVEAERHLRLAAANDARAWSRPDVRVLAVDQRPLRFSSWSLFQITVAEGGQIGAIDVIASASRAVLLDGQSVTVSTLIEDGVIQLESSQAQSEYTRFFCSSLRADSGRFQIVDSLADLRLGERVGLADGVRIQPWEPVASASAVSDPTYVGTVFYSGGLSRADFRLRLSAASAVDMIEDEPIEEALVGGRERFEGPIRFDQRVEEAG